MKMEDEKELAMFVYILQIIVSKLFDMGLTKDSNWVFYKSMLMCSYSDASKMLLI